MASARSGDHAPAALEHLRVLDLTTELGTLAVRFLSGFGATVIRPTPPEGDPFDAIPPFAIAPDGSRASLYAAHMLAGREFIDLDIDTDAGRAELLRILARTDIVVESQAPGRLASLGIDYADLAGEFPRLIWTSITPFGRTGPRAGWAGTDLVGMAAGGLLSLCGDPDRPPLRPSVEQGYAQAGLHALVGTLAALHTRNGTGRGQLVDVSMQEAVATCLGNARLFYEFEGTMTRRAGGARAYGAHGSRLVYPCADGYIAFARTPDALQPLYDWIADSGLRPRFDPEEWARLPQSGAGTPGPEKTRELEESLLEFFQTRPKMELYEEGQARGIMICPVSSPADLLENRQLIDRGYFRDRIDERTGMVLTVPGPPVRMSATPWRDEPSTVAKRAADASAPLHPGSTDSRDVFRGLRVADFSWVGVGPLSTQQLAWLGAEVIRVESSTRLDVFRTGGPQRGRYPDASAYWANCNRDKDGMTLNLKHPRARDVALRLAERSDVLVESFTPGFFSSVGLSYADVRAVNPSIIMMSCSMEGADGPHAQFRGFGLVLQGTVGFTHFTSWPDRAPAGTGVAYTDWVATHVAAAALLAALEHRRRTGEGQYIDLSQLEACAWALDAEILRYTATGELRPPLGNGHPTMSPHGVYPAKGDDEWVALAVRTASEWAALVRVLGAPELHAEALADVHARRERSERIDAAIGAWTSARGKHEAARVLQAAGVPAAAVANMADIETDEQLRARGHYWTTRHPEIGEADWNGPAYHLSGTPLYPLRPAPLLGQHNDRVYRDVLGYNDEEIAELAASGVMD